jgi:hypothetical protein
VIRGAIPSSRSVVASPLAGVTDPSCRRSRIALPSLQDLAESCYGGDRRRGDDADRNGGGEIKVYDTDCSSRRLRYVSSVTVRMSRSVSRSDETALPFAERDSSLPAVELRPTSLAAGPASHFRSERMLSSDVLRRQIGRSPPVGSVTDATAQRSRLTHKRPQGRQSVLMPKVGGDRGRHGAE